MGSYMDENYHCASRRFCDRTKHVCQLCGDYRRKYETPEQFKQRTGREWPDGGAVYMYYPEENIYKVNYHFMAKYCGAFCVCANTDFGKPPDYWKPEVNE